MKFIDKILDIKEFEHSILNHPSGFKEVYYQRCVNNILEHSNIVEWVEKYCSEYTLGSFLRIADQAKINLNGLNIRIEANQHE